MILVLVWFCSLGSSMGERVSLDPCDPRLTMSGWPLWYEIWGTCWHDFGCRCAYLVGVGNCLGRKMPIRCFKNEIPGTLVCFMVVVVFVMVVLYCTLLRLNTVCWWPFGLRAFHSLWMISIDIVDVVSYCGRSDPLGVVGAWILGPFPGCCSEVGWSPCPEVLMRRLVGILCNYLVGLWCFPM